MSTIVTSNVSDGTLSIPTTYVTNGSAKAWVNFNGTGTIAARDSLNVSSLTDVGTGNYTVNLTVAFSAADYPVTNGGNANATSNSVLAGSFQAGTASSAGTLLDASLVFAAAHGDLA